MMRALMIGRTKDIAICNWEQDYPKFLTALRRLFILDMGAVGVYNEGTVRYKRIAGMIEAFVKLWSTAMHTHGEWEESVLHKNKNLLCLAFGLGDPCDKCSHHHVDIFDSGNEC